MYCIQGEFNFTKCFSSGGDESRQLAGEQLLENRTRNQSFDVEDMFDVLRHKESRICRGCDDGFPTQGSQVRDIIRINIDTTYREYNKNKRFQIFTHAYLEII